MKHIRLFLLSLVALASAGCHVESDKNPGEGEKKPVKMTFSATSGATKTSIENFFIIWKTSDEISVFDEAGTNCIFSLSKGAGTNSAEFEGKALPSSVFYALYPYTSGASISGNEILKVKLPAVQKIKLTSGLPVDPTAMLMVSRSVDSTNLPFRNVMSYIKVTPAEECDSILVTSASADVSLTADTITVTVPEEGTPTYTVVADGRPRAVLSTGSGDRLTADKDYYIAVLPGMQSNGLRIDFIYKESPKYSVRYSQVELKAGYVYTGGGGTKLIELGSTDTNPIKGDTGDWF